MANCLPTAKYLEKRVLLPLFSFFILVFLSACSNSARVWECSSNTGINDDYCSSRLSLSPDNKFTGLHLEILNTSRGVLGFINLNGLAIQEECKSADGSSEVTVHVTVDEKNESFRCFLFKGGHRIRLKNEALDMIIEGLKNNQAVKVSVCHYSSELIANDFAILFENMRQ